MILQHLHSFSSFKTPLWLNFMYISITLLLHERTLTTSTRQVYFYAFSTTEKPVLAMGKQEKFYCFYDYIFFIFLYYKHWALFHTTIKFYTAEIDECCFCLFLMIGSSNPVPLPPRDRNRPIATNKPRHQRKHPLIIPGNAMRTLARLNGDSAGLSLHKYYLGRLSTSVQYSDWGETKSEVVIV